MGNLTFDDYLLLLNSKIYRQKIKIEVLRTEDLSIINEITADIINGGNINIERKQGMRRTASFSLINSTIFINGKYIPNIDDEILPPLQPFKLYTGLSNENNDIYWISQGVFVLQNPSITSNFSESVVNIECCDLFGLLDGTILGEVNYTYIIDNGSNIFNVIKSILLEIGYFLDPILDSQFLNSTIPYKIIKESGSGTLGDILIELAYIVSCNIYFNQDGRLVFCKDIRDDIKPSEFDFTTENSQYLGGNNIFKYDLLYNACLVIADNVNSEQPPYIYEAVNTNLMSSTSVNNLGYKRTKRYDNANVYSLQLAKELAEYLLKRLIAVQQEITITAIPIGFLKEIDVDTIITITDENFNFNKERFLITSISLPLQIGGTMSITAVKAVDLEFGDV